MKIDNSTPEGQMQSVGILTMVVAVIEALQGIASFAFPSEANAAALATIPSGFVTGAVIVILIMDAVEFYFGLIAYQRHATKVAATVLLVFGILEVIGIVGNFVTGVPFNQAITPLLGAVVALTYYYSFKQLES